MTFDWRNLPGDVVEGVNHFSLPERALTGGTPSSRSIHALIRG